MKKYLLLISLFIASEIRAQTYMHEAAEDSDGSPLGGILALLVICGIIYLIEKYRSSLKEINEAKEKERQKREIATSVSNSSLERHKDISIFQNKIAWQKGYINATYDIQYNKIHKLYNKSINDLINEYHKKQNFDITTANKIMEEIGYFEHLEHNNKCLIKEGREPFNYITLNKSVTIKSNK